MKRTHQSVLATAVMAAACAFAGGPAALAAGPCSPGQHLAQNSNQQNPPGSFKVAGQNGGSTTLAEGGGGGNGGSDRRAIEQADSGGGGGNGGSDRRTMEMASAACQ